MKKKFLDLIALTGLSLIGLVSSNGNCEKNPVDNKDRNVDQLSTTVIANAGLPATSGLAGNAQDSVMPGGNAPMPGAFGESGGAAITNTVDDANNLKKGAPFNDANELSPKRLFNSKGQ